MFEWNQMRNKTKPHIRLPCIHYHGFSFSWFFEILRRKNGIDSTFDGIVNKRLEGFPMLFYLIWSDFVQYFQRWSFHHAFDCYYHFNLNIKNKWSDDNEDYIPSIVRSRHNLISLFSYSTSSYFYKPVAIYCVLWNTVLVQLSS